MPNEHRHVYKPVDSTSFAPVDNAGNEEVGATGNLENCSLKEIDPKLVASVASCEEAQKRQTQPLSAEKEAYIRKAANLEQALEQLQKTYLNLIFRHRMAASQNKMDLGRTKTLLQDIKLRNPAYVKQFKIPDVHRQDEEQNVVEG